ncbi:methylenetetrahydrofolate dehydrogenase (nadp+) / methenyltetrahydrofolate cyclohydrolase [hydrocarbon metagenome]|uniref:Methylenetetrahydrofolate dehydrogenase (Nadp+) / methenyltetrahydrofolate cyclohydrolase n=1 Tax=hydrocarbon metagenome TaxID=938273 RepID=A0A0W8E8Q0_9ZZZZ
MELISGTKIAEEIKADLKEQNLGKGICPNLAVILVGDNKESMIYVGLKENAARSISGSTSIIELPADISKMELLNAIAKANHEQDTDGIIIQLPLPDHLAPWQDEFLEAVREEKDVDGFNPANRGKLIGGKPKYVSCAALACMEVIDRYVESPEGKNVILVGDSFDLILPLSIRLISEGFNVQVINEYKPDWIRQADVLVVEKGSANMVKGEHLRDGMLVIDAGFYWDGGKTHGNVDKESVSGISGHLLPVPGGVGPLLIAKLMENVSQAAIINRSI